MKKNKKNNFNKLLILFVIVLGLVFAILNLNNVFDGRSDATGKYGKVRNPTSIPSKKPTPKPTSILGGGCCSDRDCNPNCAGLNCMVYKCRNSILCKSGGNGHGTCVKK